MSRPMATLMEKNAWPIATSTVLPSIFEKSVLNRKLVAAPKSPSTAA